MERSACGGSPPREPDRVVLGGTGHDQPALRGGGERAGSRRVRGVPQRLCPLQRQLVITLCRHPGRTVEVGHHLAGRDALTDDGIQALEPSSHARRDKADASRIGLDLSRHGQPARDEPPLLAPAAAIAIPAVRSASALRTTRPAVAESACITGGATAARSRVVAGGRRCRDCTRREGRPQKGLMSHQRAPAPGARSRRMSAGRMSRSAAASAAATSASSRARSARPMARSKSRNSTRLSWPPR